MYKIFCIGWPSVVGGAGGEYYHTARLWAQAGCQVTAIPTWGPPPADEGWLGQLARHGIQAATARELHLRKDVPAIEGSIVVGFCNPFFVRMLGRLKVWNCRTVYCGLMNWATTVPDRQVFMSTTGFPSAMIYQSNFQKKCMEFNYKGWGYTPQISTVIRGAFSTDEWPYRFFPRTPSDPFTIIRVSRPDADKWAANFFSTLNTIDCPTKQAILMGVNDETKVKLGKPVPPYVQLLPPKAIQPTQDLYARAHIHICTNGPFNNKFGLNGTPENAPIVARESASAGVPIIAPNAFGWPEVVVHGETGLLANNDQELSEYATLLSRDERLREHLSTNARRHLEENTANPETIWQQWKAVFDKIQP